VPGIFTRDERAVVVFLTAALAVGSIVLLARRVEPLDDAPPAAGEAVAPAPAGPLDLNAASRADLERLPGIGPVRAAAVLELRDARGRLSSIEELVDVRGIGPKTLERLRPLVCVGDSVRGSGVSPKEANAGERHDR